jgi:hypothetical protein
MQGMNNTAPLSNRILHGWAVRVGKIQGNLFQNPMLAMRQQSRHSV